MKGVRHGVQRQGQTRSERLTDLERFLIENSHHLTAGGHADWRSNLKAFFSASNPEERTWYMFIHRNEGSWDELEKFWLKTLLTMAQSFAALRNNGTAVDPWLRVCNYVFAHKGEVQRASGDTLFEKLKFIGRRQDDAVAAFSALVDVAKDIRSTERVPWPVGDALAFVLNSRIMLMLHWAWSHVHCVEALERGDDTAETLCSLLGAVLKGIPKTLDQIVEHGLPSIAESDS